jgi:outer membrane protein OmpA-like peptidoglycan-associated protein
VASDELADDRLMLEGHTDTKGAEDYNLALSERRAKAAGDYLRDIHGIGADRLSYACKGETEPLDPANPEGAINRRLEVRNLG